MAARGRVTAFHRWSVLARLPILPTFAGFVLMDVAPPVLPLFGTFDTGCALWTRWAWRGNRRLE